MNEIENLKQILDGDYTPKAVRHAFEEVIHRNVIAIKEFSEGTRKLIRTHNEELESLRNQLVAQKEELDEYKQQIALIQARLYQSGL